MGFFRRLRNVVSANLYDLLECCENPERLLRHAIRGMEEALRAALAGAAKVLAHEHLLERQRADAQADGAAWRRQAEAAVRAGDDEAARQALRRAHEQQMLASVLAFQHSEAAAASRKLRRQVEALRRRLQEARRERDLLIARRRALAARRHVLGAFSDLPLDTDGFQEFERMARKVREGEAEADALAELAAVSVGPEGNVAEREAAAWIEAELGGIKRAAAKQET